MEPGVQLTNIIEYDFTPYTTKISTFMRITGMYDNPEVALQSQYKQLDEEVDELYYACKTFNKVELLDAIGDCVFVYTTLALLKIHLQDKNITSKSFFTLQGILSLIHPTVEVLDYCLDAVITSNLSKFDKNEYEASNTVAHYIILNVETEALFDTESGLWFVRVIEDCTDTNGKTYHKGKILKSVINYHEPDFSLALEEPEDDDSTQ